MAPRLGRKDVWYVSLLCGSLLLLAVQVALGGQGFDRPHGGVLGLLEAPGRVVGWGGVALCAAGVPFLLLRWWRGGGGGGFTEATGAMVLAIGVGGFGGLFATPPVAGGGMAGARIALVLEHVLGPWLAAVALASITAPGLLLMLRPLFVERVRGRGRPAATFERSTEPKAKPWYPERRVGNDGVEIPMQLPGTDVGPIRYRDPEPEAAAPAGANASASAKTNGAAAAPPAPPPRAESRAAPPKRPSGIPGIRYADETEAAEPVSQDLTQDAVDIPGVRFRREDHGERLPPGVRYVEAEVAAPTESLESHPAANGHSIVADAEFAPEAPEGLAVPDDAPSVTVTATASPSSMGGLRTVEAERAFEIDDDIVPPGGISRSTASHRRKLASTGVFAAPGGASAPAIARPAKPKPRPAKPQDIQDALRGLFSSLPYDELPPPMPASLAANAPPAPAPAPEVEAPPEPPGQLALFESKPKPRSESKPKTEPRSKAKRPEAEQPKDAPAIAAKGRESSTKKEAAKKDAPAATKEKAPPAPPPGRSDALFVSAVEAALERGAASLVLLQRRFGIGYARAASLMDALAADGIVGETTASGSRPTTITAADWAKRRKR